MTDLSDRLDRLSDISHELANIMHDRGDDESKKQADQLYRVAKITSEWAAVIRKKETKQC
jgi:hypothetical protein